MRTWDAPIYGFYEPIPEIEEVGGRRCHVFICAAAGCRHKVRRSLDTHDKRSTSNLRTHSKKCWGDVFKKVYEMKNSRRVRVAVSKLKKLAKRGRRGKQNRTWRGSVQSATRIPITVHHQSRKCTEARARPVRHDGYQLGNDTRSTTRLPDALCISVSWEGQSTGESHRHSSHSWCGRAE